MVIISLEKGHPLLTFMQTQDMREQKTIKLDFFFVLFVFLKQKSENAVSAIYFFGQSLLSHVDIYCS